MFDITQLMEIRRKTGLNQADFARKIGYSREVVSKIENGKMEPSKWFMDAMFSFVNEQKFEQIGADVKLLGKFSQTHVQKNGITYFQQRQTDKNIPESFMVPLVGIKAQAGYMKGYEEVDFLETLEQYSLPPGVNPAGAVWRYFEIDGDSMEPTLYSSDVVLATMVPAVDWQDIRNFSVYVIHTEDQLLIKRIYKKTETEWVLISDNEEQYPQVLIPVASVKQVWLFRRHIRAKLPAKDFRITA